MSLTSWWSHYKKGNTSFIWERRYPVSSGSQRTRPRNQGRLLGQSSAHYGCGSRDFLGEAFSCADNTALTVSAVAAENTEIMVLDVDRIMSTCSKFRNFHNRLIRNLVTILAEKNSDLTTKITHMSQRRMREKLLSYLSEQSANKGSSNFDIPFNRQELADLPFRGTEVLCPLNSPGYRTRVFSHISGTTSPCCEKITNLYKEAMGLD